MGQGRVKKVPKIRIKHEIKEGILAEHFVSVSKVMEMLGMTHYQVVEKLPKSGVRLLTVGNKYYIPKKDVEDYARYLETFKR
jgi:hypothetical protein